MLALTASAPLVCCGEGLLPRDYRRGLPDHLAALAARACEVRRRALDALTTTGSIQRRQAWVRGTLWRLVGGVPERTPLALQAHGALERAGYRMEKLVYESRPGFHVTANLYVPIGRRGPFPGVLFQAGHLPAGKGAAPYQRCCQALVRLGHVVLAFDPAGQGERVYYPGPDGRQSRLGAPDDEHDRAGRQLLLTGDTQTRLMLWDAVRSLDVLASRPEVDPRRLASIGHSGGGTLTMLLAAVDDRLAAAAISCANTENVACAGFTPPGSTDDAEQNLLGAGPLGFDRWDLLHPLAPRPLLVLTSAQDPFTTYSPGYLSSGREQVERLARVYATLGKPDHLRWVETAEPHGLSDDRSREIARWLGRHLLPETPEAPPGAPESPEPEEATWVFPGGNVVRALGGLTPLGLARARAAEPSRPPGELSARLGVVRPEPGLAATRISRACAQGCEVEALEVRSSPQVWLPARLLLPPWVPRSVVLALAPDVPAEAWSTALAHAGHAVCVADLRGMGALRPDVGVAPGASGYARNHANEESYAWASLILGESLLAQRIADVLALVEALSNHPALRGCPLALAAQGVSTIPALFAAAIDSRIALVYLDGGLASYRSLLDTADDACPLANRPWGILPDADLPEVASAVGPRPVILAGPVDGAGRPMALAEARALHRRAPHVRITPAPAWGFEALAAVLP